MGVLTEIHKKTTLILFLLCLSITGFAQQHDPLEQVVTIDVKDITIGEVLKDLEADYNVPFSYSSSLIDLDKKVSIKATDVPLGRVLDQLLAQTYIDYKVIGEQIVLSKGDEPRKLPSIVYGSISGKISDSGNAETLPGVNVYLANSSTGTISDFDGHFKLSRVPAGTHQVVISMIGYGSDTLDVEVTGKAETKLDHAIEPQTMELAMTTVQGDQITGRTTVSNIALSEPQLRTAQTMTEDPMQTLGTLPGVTKAGRLFEAGGFSVRGGDPGENLYMLDNALLVFPWTFAGRSTYNPSMIEKAELLTGGFPVTYGHFMSSVLNITTKSGNMNEYRGSASISLLNMEATVEGPIKEGKASFIASGRNSVLDLIVEGFPLFDDQEFPGMRDLTYKFRYDISEKNRITYSGYHSESELKLLFVDTVGNVTDVEGYNQTHTSSLQWKSQWGDKVYSKLSLLNSLVDIYGRGGITNETTSSLNDHYLREDITIWVTPFNKIKTGFEGHYYVFNSAGHEPLYPQFYFMNDTSLERYDYNVRTAQGTAGGYALYDGTLLGRLKTNTGIRIDKDLPDGNMTIAPRSALSFEFNKNLEVRLAYGIYHQIPGPLAYFYNPNILSGRADHYILGITKKFNSTWSGWIEGYYKDYKTIIIKERFNWFTDDGSGSSKGVEAFLRKDSGKLTGWISYALSRSLRQDSLGAEIYIPNQDQTHVFNLVADYKFKRRPRKIVPSRIAGNLRIATGRPYTPLLSADIVDNQWQPIFGARNSQRNGPYHNLNMRIVWERQTGKKKQHQFNTFLEIWNLYGQKSVTSRGYTYNVQVPGNISERPQIVEPFLLTIGFKFYFNQTPGFVAN